jgi:hypothetical protein
MHGSTCFFWTNLTPFSLGPPQVQTSFERLTAFFELPADDAPAALGGAAPGLVQLGGLEFAWPVPLAVDGTVVIMPPCIFY